MSFYQYYTYKSSGEALSGIEDFANAATGTQFEKVTGDVYVKAAAGIYDKTTRKIIGQSEMDARYAALAANNTFTGHQYVSVDNIYNIGASAKRFANVYAVTFNGTATSANYADLAEKYLTDKEYPVGTVLEIGGEKEVTIYNGGALAGVVSGQPGYMLNAESDGQYVALKGKVPVFCRGFVQKGQYCLAVDGGKVIGVDKDDINDAELLDIVGIALEDSKNGVVVVKV